MTRTQNRSTPSVSVSTSRGAAGPLVIPQVAMTLPEARRAVLTLVVPRRMLFAFGAMFLLGMMLFGQDANPALGLALLGGALAGLWMMAVRIPRKVLRAHRASTWTATANGLRITVSDGETSLTWQECARVSARSLVIGFRLKSGGVVVLPRRCLRPGQDRLLESWVRAAGVPVTGNLAAPNAR